MKKSSSVVPSTHKRLCDDELFKDVAELLEKTENSSGPDKLRRLKKYIAFCRAKFKSIHGSLDSGVAHVSIYKYNQKHHKM